MFGRKNKLKKEFDARLYNLLLEIERGVGTNEGNREVYA